jgi:hypothetical protein
MGQVNLKKGEALVLRTCDKNMKSHGGFVWPKRGKVKAPDWDSQDKCGKGLHGLLWGQGDGALLNWEDDVVWMVLVVKQNECVDLGGQVKFPSCRVIYAGDQKTATDMILSVRPGAVVGCTAVGGPEGTAVAGYKGTAIAGDRGTATAGYHGIATARIAGIATVGNYGIATAMEGGDATAGVGGIAVVGDYGTATAGDYGRATAGYKGTATAGIYGTAVSGDGGTATAGDYGTATAGEEGTAVVGDYGIATVGGSGTAMAGKGGILNFGWYDGRRYRIATFYVGEDGTEENVAYTLKTERINIESVMLQKKTS